MNNKRYLVITELFLPTKGGSAVWFDEVYSRLGGKEIHIVTADVEGAAEYDKHHPNTIHRVSLKRYWWLKPESLAMYLKLFWTALKVVMSNKIDVVHAGRVLPEGFIAYLIARLSGKKVLIYAHGEEITTWRQSGKFKVMRFTYQHADIVIANSEFTRKELEKIGVKPEKIILISPGVDIERFKPMDNVRDLREQIGISEQQKLVLSVGRLSRRKGFDQVVKSIAALRAENIDVHYAVIGIGEDEQYLKELAERDQVDAFYHALGHVSREDLPRWYNAADVFIMPNREIDGDTEGFGMVFLEASACGKAVISGDAGGTGDAVVNNKTGLRINASELDNVTNALRTLLTNAELTTQYGKNGLKRAREDYSWNSVAEKTRSIRDR